jgi:hypothetical protein
MSCLNRYELPYINCCNFVFHNFRIAIGYEGNTNKIFRKFSDDLLTDSVIPTGLDIICRARKDLLLYQLKY